MKVSDKLARMTRRDLFKVAGSYGMSSTLLAAGTFGGAMTVAELAKAAESTTKNSASRKKRSTC